MSYHRWLRIISSSIFFLWSLVCISQDDSLTFYPVNNSLLQQYNIRNITPTKDGKLWLNTGNGLIAYDGNDIRIYSHDASDSTSLSDHNISNSFLDRKGNLFVVLRGEKQNSNEQINYFNTKTGKTERFKIRIENEDSSGYHPIDPFLIVYMDSDSTLLAGRTNMGFIRYNLLNRKAVSYSLRSASNTTFNTVYSIHKDTRDHNLAWLATNNGIYSFNSKTNQLQRNFRSNNVKDSTTLDLNIMDIHVRNKDTIWFLTYIRGLGCYDIKTGQYTIFPRRRVNEERGRIVYEEDRFHADGFQYLNKDQYLITMTGRTPWIFDITTHKYISHSKITPAFPVLYFSQSVIDDFGNIWCLFYGKLYKATPKKIRLQAATIYDKYYTDRRENTFKTVIWDEKRRLYYVGVSLGDGVFIFDENMQFIKTIPAPRTNDPEWGLIEPLVIDIALDKNDRLWMCSNILCVYDSLKQQFVPASTVFPGLASTYKQFRNFVFRGDWCYALPGDASSSYLYRININSLTCDSLLLSAIPVAEKQPPNQLGTLEMDNSGENAYISNKNTVFQYNLITSKTRKIIELTDSDKPYGYWTNFHWYNVDDDDNLWVSSINKTWIFEPVNLKVIKMFEREKNTYFNQAYNIKDKGIMCYLNSTSYDLYDYKNNKQYKITINDGLNSYSNWSTACVNGMLFVGAYHYFQYIPLSSVINKKTERRCYLSDIRLFDLSYKTDTLPEYLQVLKLPHDKNFISFTFSSTEFDQPEALEYRYKLQGINNDWVYVNYLNRTVSYTNLGPGNYTFYASVKNDDGAWSDNDVHIQISIIPAWWQTNWFKLLAIVVACCLTIVVIQLRIRAVRRQERLKGFHEKELLELEAKALRAQMNPHFIFNCLNSIKALIQEDEKQKATDYLTTFSKLIRTLFQNSDKRQISLFDEVETCRLYTQLEAMRLKGKLNYNFIIDPNVDLKSVMVPALIIQPFIENAIWHGIVPKEVGTINVSIKQKKDAVVCEVDDDGIGRELSKLNKPVTPVIHESKGVHLSLARIDLEKKLNESQASIKIIDKYENDKATGTRVVLTFNLN